MLRGRFSVPAVLISFTSPLLAALALASLCTAADSPALKDVLAKEARGEAVDRTGVPQQSNLERWSAGKVQIEGQWKELKQLDSQVADLSGYQRQRDKSEQTVEAQLTLARWCERHRLPEQAAAHYYAALAIEPNNQIARQELQHQWQNDRWFTKREIETAKDTARQLSKNLNTWTPKIKSILQKLTSQDADQKIAGLSELDAINDETVIPALEVAIGVIDPQVALPLVKKIADFKSEDACRALLVLAVSEPPHPLAGVAIEKLAGYPEAMVVPDLLSALSTPLEVHAQTVGLPNGRLASSTLVTRELKDRKLVDQSETQYRIVSRLDLYPYKQTVSALTGSPLQIQNRRGVVHYIPPEVLKASQSSAAQEQEQLKLQVEAENVRIQAQVARVCEVLRKITHEMHGDDPKLWWEWWSIRHDKYIDPKIKPIIQRRKYDQKDLSNTTELQILSDFSSCLVAGTMVQTQTGLRAIDEIKVGDLVASQDIETAELVLKPVIRTTRAHPKPLIAIVTEREEIRATPAHYWWVAGQGWKRSCELASGMQFHTATGTVAIKAVRDAEPQETYNLVVDEFHTYFVGADRILSYDVMPLKGTLKQVPGL